MSAGVPGRWKILPWSFGSSLVTLIARREGLHLIHGEAGTVGVLQRAERDAESRWQLEQTSR